MRFQGGVSLSYVVRVSYYWLVSTFVPALTPPRLRASVALKSREPSFLLDC